MTETELPTATPVPAPGSGGHITEHKHGGLGEFASTAICGNDITSSCLYVSALAIGAAGKLAPFALIVVAALLYLFRRIYAEVVGALPLNGGAYNALLNTTSKSRASFAACLTILSYMATAVISAGEAMHYAHNLWGGLPLIPATMALLAFFTVLTIMGISESSRVAIAIFVTHLVTLAVLLLVGAGSLLTSETGLSVLRDNWAQPLFVSERLGAASDDKGNTEFDAAGSSENPPIVADQGQAEPPGFVTREIGLMQAIFFGFAVALLGISGFESSANFVEEQAEGVFPKTLRNMWFAVSFFNPAMAFLALALVPIITIQQDHTVQFALLAHLGRVAGGKWFGPTLSTIISVDAFLVLSGAVLTSFVGVNGLVRRMTLDRCLPQFLLKTNARGTTHRILLTFFLMCVSVLLITNADVEKLAGVYTLSFLTVMALFGIGNILLKVKRSRLPRPTQASWLSVLVAIAAVGLGLVGNAVKNPEYVYVFGYYFVPTMTVIGLMLYRIPLLRLGLSVLRIIASSLIGPLNQMKKFVRDKIDEINSQQVVYFTRGDNVANLNTAMLYVSGNEDTNRIKIVTVVRDKKDVPSRLTQDLQFLDEAYPEIDIEFVVIEGIFGPELIQHLSQQWHVPTNLMFIGSPGNHFMYGLAELGGVRLII